MSFENRQSPLESLAVRNTGKTLLIVLLVFLWGCSSPADEYTSRMVDWEKFASMDKKDVIDMKERYPKREASNTLNSIIFEEEEGVIESYDFPFGWLSGQAIIVDYKSGEEAFSVYEELESELVNKYGDPKRENGDLIVWNVSEVSLREAAELISEGEKKPVNNKIRVVILSHTKKESNNHTVALIRRIGVQAIGEL